MLGTTELLFGQPGTLSSDSWIRAPAFLCTPTRWPSRGAGACQWDCSLPSAVNTAWQQGTAGTQRPKGAALAPGSAGWWFSLGSAEQCFWFWLGSLKSLGGRLAVAEAAGDAWLCSTGPSAFTCPASPPGTIGPQQWKQKCTGALSNSALCHIY